MKLIDRLKSVQNFNYNEYAISTTKFKVVDAKRVVRMYNLLQDIMSNTIVGSEYPEIKKEFEDLEKELMEGEVDIEIHIITHNEQIMLPYTLNWYRRMFKNPKFFIWDNNSFDKTLEIARVNNCTINSFETSGMNDGMQSKIKSEAIRNCKATWCIVIDCDEELLINDADLLKTKANVIQLQGYNVFTHSNSPWESNLDSIKDDGYSKTVCIKTSEIASVDLAPGAHSISNIIPKEGFEVVYSIKEFKLVHMKHWSLKYNIERSKYLASRQSEDNLKKRHSFHFAFSEEIHTNYFNECYNRREPLIDERLKLLQ